MSRGVSPRWGALRLALVALLVLACKSQTQQQRLDAEQPPASSQSPLLWTTGAVPVAAFVAERIGAVPEYHQLVYVGASWCEPCRRFHDAVKNGDFSEALSGVEIVAYDLDRQREPLREAGYFSRLIPLFALPRGDGHASEQRIAGGIKGPSAAQHILRRLRPLLAHAPQSQAQQP